MNTYTYSILKRSIRIFLPMNGILLKPKSKKPKKERKNYLMLLERRDMKRRERELMRRDKLD
jgi:hypothetical protein